MATRPRSRASGRSFDRARYETDAAAFIAEQGEQRYRNLAGQADLYERHKDLFARNRVDALRALVEGDGREPGNRALLAFATDGLLNGRVATLTDAIARAESRAMVGWRGEQLPYRGVRSRIEAISERTERNGLFETYLRAVEAINTLRVERLDTLHEAVRELGYVDYVEMVRTTRGWNPDQVAAAARIALNDTETGYYAAARRAMARIGIEHGDGTLADLWYVLRGTGWDAWFEPRRLVPTLEATFAGIGLALGSLKGATMDVETRPNQAAQASWAVIRAPGDVRLVLRPIGSWTDVASGLHEAAHLAQFAGVAEGTPVSSGLLGDHSVSEGYATLFESLLGEPEWLEERLGMSAVDQMAFLDFYALCTLQSLRQLGGQLLYELGLHRGGDHGVHRAMYAGTLGLLAGVTWPEELYLESVDDDLRAASSLRGFQLAGAIDGAFAQRYPSGWWRSSEAGSALRERFGRGSADSAEQVVASLGYDALDWRPVLRKIRTQLIGEMSGYGGPNITTRAGTRKI